MAIAQVQTKTATTGATGIATLSLVFDAAPTNAGTLIVAIAGAGGIWITPNANIIWDAISYSGASASFIALFRGRVITGSASATVAINSTATTSGISAAGIEYSSDTEIAFDRSTENTGTSTTGNSGTSPTTTAAAAVWIGAFCSRLVSGATFSAPTNSYTIIGQTKSTIGSSSDRSVCIATKAVSSTGTPQVSVTISGSSSIYSGISASVYELGASAGSPTVQGGFFVT